MLASFYLIIIDINEKIKLPLKPNDYNKKNQYEITNKLMKSSLKNCDFKNNRVITLYFQK
jgi:hypothetical protein